MWPGQQPPGGEQNPQDANPYQQPGYPNTPPPGQPPAGGQPTPPPGPPPGGYQQPPTVPGYGYPAPGSVPTPPPPGTNPYQNQFNAPTHPGPIGPGGPGGPGGPQNDKKKNIVTAAVAGVVVIAALVGTGVFLFKDDGDEKQPVAEGKTTQSPAAPKQPSAPPATDPATPPTGGSSSNPRAGIDAKPTIPGWKVVLNPKHGTVFDVPPEWVVGTTGTIVGFEDEKNPTGKPVVAMSAPASLKDNWCQDDDDHDGKMDTTGLSRVGTKGANGAKNTGEVAEIQAGNWVYAGYDQKRTGKINVVKPKPFTTTSGLTGHISTATATGVKKPSKCDTDGKATAFGFKNAKGDYAAWVLYSAKGVKDEVPDATIMKILGTLRLPS
ncbi:hypothetical protein ACFYVL_42425 [Streptomyces sp. NPDC004111]|uniref:hypothetical protein n=1 Tax=Streptomyces sp. NPDC004111 TaxID=3364690 RepID=UPI0036C71077